MKTWAIEGVGVAIRAKAVIWIGHQVKVQKKTQKIGSKTLLFFIKGLGGKFASELIINRTQKTESSNKNCPKSKSEA